MARTIQILPGARPVLCPMCGAEISWRYAANAFSCPACGCGLELRRRYYRAISVISFAIAFGLSYLSGYRGSAILAPVLFLTFPIQFVVASITLRLFPPDVEVSGNVRGILHPVGGQNPALPPDPIVIGARTHHVNVPGTASQSRGSYSFRLPQTFEAWGIAIVVVIIVGYAAYQVAEPFIYVAWPEYRATKHGPRGFPITLHIGEDALRITNESSEQWECAFGLGSFAPHRASVAVDAGATVDILYDKFQTVNAAATHDRRAERIAAARAMISANCFEPGGTRRHSFSW